MPSKSKHYGTKAWRVVRRQVLDRDQYRCTIGMEGCTGTATQVDHIHPLAFGGAPFDRATFEPHAHHATQAAQTNYDGSRAEDGKAMPVRRHRAPDVRE